MERYTTDALLAEMERSTRQLNTLRAWLEVEPEDDAVRERIRQLMPRHKELIAAVRRVQLELYRDSVQLLRGHVAALKSERLGRLTLSPNEWREIPRGQ